MHTIDLAQSAKTKMKSETLLTLDEVAAMLSLAPQTVHALPLKSIRLGRSLRFDPKDVRRLIENSKEPFLVFPEQSTVKAERAKPEQKLINSLMGAQ